MIGLQSPRGSAGDGFARAPGLAFLLLPGLWLGRGLARSMNETVMVISMGYFLCNTTV